MDVSGGACSRAKGMAMACQPFHSFSFCRLQSPAPSIASLPWNSPCAVIGVTAVLRLWPRGPETWKQLRWLGISSALLYCPKRAYRLDSHSACKAQNLQEILKVTLQYVNDTPHTWMRNFKYEGVIEQGGKQRERKGKCFSGPVLLPSWLLPSSTQAVWHWACAAHQKTQISAEISEMTKTRSY